MIILRLPEPTYPLIDKLKARIEAAYSLADKVPDHYDGDDLRGLLRSIAHELLGEADALEDIRSANAQLRDCAEGYMERCDELEAQIKT